jgi:hypothetical protein
VSTERALFAPASMPPWPGSITTTGFWAQTRPSLRRE